jgi:hypothetical protein
MSDKLEKLKAKKTVLYSMIAFWVTFVAIVIVHNITGTAGLHIDYSISKYVGLTFPSAICFLIVNTAVSIAMWRYLSPKLENKAQRAILIYIIITLIGLSLCPIGLFDNIIPEPVILGRTPISFMHVLTSRTMFVAMAAFSLVTFYLGKHKSEHDKNVQKVCLSFFIYAAICTVAFIFFPQVFWAIDIIFESVYIAYFFMVVLLF